MRVIRKVAGAAAAGVALAALTGCGPDTAASAGGPSSTATVTPAPDAATSTRTAPGGSFSASPFVAPVTGTVVADASGTGPKSLGPLPDGRSLNVVYDCARGSMTATREPDITSTFSCVGGPSLITFAAITAGNRNPVEVSMTDPTAQWSVKLVVG
ncbi:hypothetical protein HJ588_04145 [Flexivirga sp. ID2601S]|uniref:Uncharacterized protein n=1 Tax=Flexivirga aerilata TaxID=1656889 RepID=A0A849AD79_9MICO|nr:hypothetical protein [Flexivirga aerilata]NNG38465.1 hypothetical protein [Flexivirga aerilata]